MNSFPLDIIFQSAKLNLFGMLAELLINFKKTFILSGEQRFMTAARTFFCLIILVFYAGAQSAAEESPVPTNWTVQQAVQFAHANSPDSKVAMQRIAAARAAIDQSRSAFYPKLDVSAGYGRTNNPMYSFGNILNHGVFDNSINFNDPGTTDNLNMSSSLQYRFYNGGHDQAGLKMAQAEEAVSEMQQVAVYSRLSFEVVRAFFTIAQAEETVLARISATKAIEASLSVAQARYDAGDLLKTDLLNLEVQKSTARENLIQARHGLELAKRGFLNLLGLVQGEVSIVQGKTCKQKVPESVSYENRPELKSMDAMIKAAGARVRQARSGYYPSADAFGSYQVDKGYIDEDSSGNSWMAGVKVNYTLFDGKRTSAQVVRAQAQLAEVKELKHKMELAFNLQLEQASLGLKEAEQRLQVTEKRVELATESARLSRERFLEGLILSSDLIDVENRLTDTLVRHTQARAARRIAVADLRWAGGMGQFQEKIESCD